MYGAAGRVGKLNLALVSMAMNQSCYALIAKAHFGQRYLYVVAEGDDRTGAVTGHGCSFDAVIVATVLTASLSYPA